MSQTTGTASGFLSDNTINVSGALVRSKLPRIPNMDKPVEVYTGGFVEQLYFALILKHTSEKTVFIRALASGIACVLETTNVNLTGSASKPVQLVGLGAAAQSEEHPDTDIVSTNFVGAPDITYGELRQYGDLDEDELGFYFGVLCYAGVKPRTDANRTAYNENRARAVRAQLAQPPMIFIANSPFLADSVLDMARASFISAAVPRMHLMQNCAARMSKVSMGPELAFATMFLLTRDYGMGALVIIKSALLKYHWLQKAFPEVAVDLQAAEIAQQEIKLAEANTRPFLKAIYGSAFVPVQYAQIDNLLGIAKDLMRRTVKTYDNYAGGTIGAQQSDKINRLLLLNDPSPATLTTSTTEATEEEARA